MVFLCLICYRRAVWQPSPTLSCPVPKLLDPKLSGRLKLRLLDQVTREIKNIRGPNLARDDSFLDPRG